ncbi:MAG: metallophosphoesterase [Magnetococcales bacterium]|nr:metallophosphoesterase [Magnetococcales bacterium]
MNLKILSLTALTLLPLPGHAEELNTLFGYALLVEKGTSLQGDTQVLARFILEPKDKKDLKKDLCNKLELRGPSGAKPVHGKIVQRDNPDPESLPVVVCEALVDFADTYRPQGETWKVTLGKYSYEVTLPTAVKTPQRAILLGDTGCRDKKGTQTCEDASWPFAETIPRDIAKLVEDRVPTILVHMGDYKYRKKGEDDDKSRVWQNWKKDLFLPIAHGDGTKTTSPNLFAVGPWVAARGNHELCRSFGDNGPGWFLFLDPSSTLLGDKSLPRCQGSQETVTPAHRLDFGHGFSIVTTDSASLAEGKANAAQAEALRQTLTAVDQSFGKKGRLAWWLTHKPIFSAVNDPPKIANATEQAAVAALPGKTPPGNIKLMVGGHKHFHQSVEAPGMPPQLVIGNGGVAINCQGFNSDKNPLNAAIRTTSTYGFVEARLQSKEKAVTGWSLNVHAYPGTSGWGQPEVVQRCTYPATGPACTVLKPEFFPVAKCASGDEED